MISHRSRQVAQTHIGTKIVGPHRCLHSRFGEHPIPVGGGGQPLGAGHYLAELTADLPAEVCCGIQRTFRLVEGGHGGQRLAEIGEVPLQLIDSFVVAFTVVEQEPAGGQKVTVVVVGMIIGGGVHAVGGGGQQQGSGGPVGRRIGVIKQALGEFGGQIGRFTVQQILETLKFVEHHQIGPQSIDADDGHDPSHLGYQLDPTPPQMAAHGAFVPQPFHQLVEQLPNRWLVPAPPLRVELLHPAGELG